ncbi:hypothetical protein ABER23_33390 [Paenibacillus lautus]
MRDAAEGKQKHGQQEHIETLNSIFIPVLTFELNLMTLPVWVSLLFF